MNYLEELKFGECFEYKNIRYIITQDYDSKNKFRCVSLTDGSLRWFDSNSLINPIDIYILDEDNNVCPIKQRKSET
jgi:hypothetical protein